MQNKTEVPEKNKYAAQEKYERTHNIIVKGFKIRKDVADQFAEACMKAGVSQAEQITRLMKDFIDQQNT